MFRQSPRSRNVRKKGLKIKHVLQISVLFGASIWLLYQVQHTDDKKPQVTTKVSENLHTDGTNGMIKLGRKGLQPRGKETNVQDKKEETTYHKTDEDDNVNEGEELRVQGHDQDEDAKQEEVGEITNTDDGMGKNTKRGYEELKVEMKGDENEEAKEKEDGVKDEKKQNHDDGNGSKNEEAKEKEDGVKDEKKQNHDDGNGSKNEEAKKKEDGVKDEKKQNHDDGNGSKNEELATIEVDGSKKSEEDNMNIPSKENNKESAQESKNEEKEDGNQMQPNPEEMVEISSPPEDDDDQNVKEEVNGNGEKRRDNGSSSKGPSVDESESGGSSPSHGETNEEDKGSGSNTTTASEGDTSTTGGTKLVRNRKIGNLPRKRMWIKSVKKNTSPNSHLVPKKNEGK